MSARRLPCYACCGRRTEGCRACRGRGSFTLREAAAAVGRLEFARDALIITDAVADRHIVALGKLISEFGEFQNDYADP